MSADVADPFPRSNGLVHSAQFARKANEAIRAVAFFRCLRRLILHAHFGFGLEAVLGILNHGISALTCSTIRRYGVESPRRFLFPGFLFPGALFSGFFGSLFLGSNTRRRPKLPSRLNELTIAASIPMSKSPQSDKRRR